MHGRELLEAGANLRAHEHDGPATGLRELLDFGADKLTGFLDGRRRHPHEHTPLIVLDARGIPCGPINTYREALSAPQARARQMIVDIDHPGLGPTFALGSPIKMSETPPVVRRHVPRLGEHTRDVLREAGMTEQEIAEVMPRPTTPPGE